VYCGKVGPITDDHVPPESLFAKPRPSNLVKVPSCRLCNSGASMDDEYFKLNLTLRADVVNHPDIKQTLPTVLRSLTKPRKLGFAKSFALGLREIYLVNHAGAIVGKTGAYNVDLARLDKVIARITKGLFYHERGIRLPDNYDVRSFSDAGLQDATADLKSDLQKLIIEPLMTQSARVVGSNTFVYRVAFTDIDPIASAWLLRFYERVSFLSLINKTDDDLQSPVTR
jgi:hypothetical protein